MEPSVFHICRRLAAVVTVDVDLYHCLVAILARRDGSGVVWPVLFVNTNNEMHGAVTPAIRNPREGLAEFMALARAYIPDLWVACGLSAYQPKNPNHDKKKTNTPSTNQLPASGRGGC